MEKKRITVLPHQFNNNDYFLLKFNFDESLVSIARSLGCRWVVSEQGWAIYRSRENLRALIRAFSDISIFDTSKIGITDAEESYGEHMTQIPEAYSQLLIRKGFSEDVMQVYKSLFRELVHHFKEKEVTNISEEELRSYIDNQVNAKKISTASEKQLIESINLYFAGVLKRKELAYPVAKREKPGRGKKSISREDLRKMLAVTPNVKHKAVMSLLYGSDLKRSQLINLKKEDVDLKKKTIKTESEQNKKPVKLRLDRDSGEILNKYIEMYKPDQWLFEGAQGDQYSNSSILSVVRRASYKAGLDEELPKRKSDPENETRSGS